ncbi:MAG: hypothetical protein J7L15_00610 [Clostridiales bacterium]|nr:hypothetical protein [Clostridiales bacterium]
MTIHVHQLAGPTISINGKLIDPDTGHAAGTATDNEINHTVTISGTEVTGVNGFNTNNKSRIPTFYVAAGESVTVTITAPSTYIDKTNTALGVVKTTYRDDSALGTFLGKSNHTADSGGVVVNMDSETFYTVNGKDPSRTKTNLYSKAFTLTANQSGSDNTILKAKTYWQGVSGLITVAQIKVYRPDITKV